jgi:hypothetical protein
MSFVRFMIARRKLTEREEDIALGQTGGETPDPYVTICQGPGRDTEGRRAV